MRESLDLVLLERFFADECSSAERQQVLEWVTSRPGGARELEAYRELCNGVSARQSQHVTDAAAWRRMETQIDRDGQRSHFVPVPGTRPENTWRWGIASAACAVVATLTVFATRHFSVVQTGGQQFREYATAAGSRGTITLNDGTRLTLGPGSHLRIPADYGQHTRTVELDGDAWLTVVHDATHPFTIRTSRSLVQDVGTTFAIHAYADESADRVVVQEGKVSLTRCTASSCAMTSSASLLSAGDLAMVGDAGIVLTHQVDMTKSLAWLQGGLNFDHTTLRDAIRELQRMFGVDITVADSALLTQHITASFGSVPVNEVLDAVTFAIGARYDRVGQKVTIRRGASRTTDPNAYPDANHSARRLNAVQARSLPSQSPTHAFRETSHDTV